MASQISPVNALLSATVHLAKRAGVPWDRIGQVLGVSPQEAHRMHAAYMAQAAQLHPSNSG
jgi:hypothetical protein